jgi:hypothetical protein
MPFGSPTMNGQRRLCVFSQLFANKRTAQSNGSGNGLVCAGLRDAFFLLVRMLAPRTPVEPDVESVPELLSMRSGISDKGDALAI